MKASKIALGITTALLLSTSIGADEIKVLKQEMQELRETTQMLIDETSDLKTGFSYTTADPNKSHSGLGAAASKVYYSSSPLSIGGYGEMYYAHTSNEGAANSSTIDVYRFVPYIGYRFSDNIILNVELEFEHGGIKEGASGDGYVVVEFMYLDFLINKNANIRVGNMLVPMGLVNEKHEPTLFTTVQRPNTSKNLIPSTWHENGVMIYGDIAEGLSYKFGGFTALQLANGAGEGDKWLRNSRLGSFRSTNPKLAVVARVDYTGINGLLLGASTYIDSDLVMFDTHVDYNLDALRVYGVYTQTSRSDTPAGEPKAAKGGYLNVGYDLLSFTSSKNKMPLFIQFENVAAQDEIAGGTSVASINTTTVGINYFPHEQVVLKADYAMYTQSGVADKNIASISMGFIF